MAEITVHINGVPCGYTFDFDDTPRCGNDLVALIEEDLVDRMAMMFLQNMRDDYPFRRRQMVGLLVQEKERRTTRRGRVEG